MSLAEHQRHVASEIGSAEAVLNSLPHPVLVVAPDGKIADGNVAAESFFEMSVSLLRRHALRDLVPFGSPLLALIEQVRTRGGAVGTGSGTPVSCSWPPVCSRRWTASGRFSPLQNRNGSP